MANINAVIYTCALENDMNTGDKERKSKNKQQQAILIFAIRFYLARK